MADTSRIAAAKRAFLTHYNPRASIAVAADKALEASILRVPTYASREMPTPKVRHQFRDHWKDRLAAFAARQEFTKSVMDCLPSILEFREVMRSWISLNATRAGACDIEFRIAHAQKSLAVYLKHLWCMGRIETPAICPIDRTILTAAHAPISERSWVWTDDLDSYSRKLEYLTNCALVSSMPVSEWELLSFPPMAGRG